MAKSKFNPVSDFRQPIQSMIVHNPTRLAMAAELRALLAEDRRIIAVEAERQRIAALRALNITIWGETPEGRDMKAYHYKRSE